MNGSDINQAQDELIDELVDDESQEYETESSVEDDALSISS